MGLIDKWLRKYQDDWCRECRCEMEKARKQLFALPGMSVGHYEEHKEAAYYREELHLVDKKADIPAGMYACGAIQYRCPSAASGSPCWTPSCPCGMRRSMRAPWCSPTGRWTISSGGETAAPGGPRSKGVSI